MKNKNFGFTLIELLVVIVIIGILATISTATFSGYFKKSRDTERQSFVRNAQQIIIAATVAQDSPDYRLGGTTGATVNSAIDTELQTQGYAVPAAKNSINYYYFTNSNGSAAYDSPAADFAVFACKEDSLGTATGSATTAETAANITAVAFQAGTVDTGYISDAQLTAACAATPAAPTAMSGWDVTSMN